MNKKTLKGVIREFVENAMGEQPQINNPFKEGDICRLCIDLTNMGEGFAKGTAVRVTGTWGNMADIEELGGNVVNEVSARVLRKIR